MNTRYKKIRDKLLGIHDTPHRIALGAGLGLFLGVFPGTGAIAAVVCAFIFRANKAAALAGALLVNTWINVVAFPVALAIGAALFRIDPATLSHQWSLLKHDFTWGGFFDLIIRDAALAVITGYIVIGLVLGGIGYAACHALISRKRAT